MTSRFIAFCDINGNWYVSDIYQEVPLLPFSKKEIATLVRDDLNIQTDSITKTKEWESDNAEN